MPANGSMAFGMPGVTIHTSPLPAGHDGQPPPYEQPPGQPASHNTASTTSVTTTATPQTGSRPAAASDPESDDAHTPTSVSSSGHPHAQQQQHARAHVQAHIHTHTHSSTSTTHTFSSSSSTSQSENQDPPTPTKNNKQNKTEGAAHDSDQTSGGCSSTQVYDRTAQTTFHATLSRWQLRWCHRHCICAYLIDCVSLWLRHVCRDPLLAAVEQLRLRTAQLPPPAPTRTAAPDKKPAAYLLTARLLDNLGVHRLHRQTHSPTRKALQRTVCTIMDMPH